MKPTKNTLKYFVSRQTKGIVTYVKNHKFSKIIINKIIFSGDYMCYNYIHWKFPKHY